MEHHSFSHDVAQYVGLSLEGIALLSAIAYVVSPILSKGRTDGSPFLTPAVLFGVLGMPFIFVGMR